VRPGARGASVAALISVAAFALRAGAGNSAQSAEVELGRAKFRMFCASCHGASGDGKGVAAGGMNPAPRDFATGMFKLGSTDQDLFDVISDGAASKGGSPLMVAWSPVLSEPERWALVKFIRSLRK
jgi:mono/diheme cytochrome c family protein